MAEPLLLPISTSPVFPIALAAGCVGSVLIVLLAALAICARGEQQQQQQMFAEEQQQQQLYYQQFVEQQGAPNPGDPNLFQPPGDGGAPYPPAGPAYGNNSDGSNAPAMFPPSPSPQQQQQQQQQQQEFVPPLPGGIPSRSLSGSRGVPPARSRSLSKGSGGAGSPSGSPIGDASQGPPREHPTIPEQGIYHGITLPKSVVLMTEPLDVQSLPPVRQEPHATWYLKEVESALGGAKQEETWIDGKSTKKTYLVRVIAGPVPEQPEQPDLSPLFVKEVAVFGLLHRHPSIAKLVGVYLGGGELPQLVLPSYPLGNLKAYLATFSGESTLARSLLHDISTGVWELHRHSIVHRDLRPESIHLEPVPPPLASASAEVAAAAADSNDREPPLRVRAVLTEFLWARVLPTCTLGITADSNIPYIGNPRYTAPEVLMNARFGGSAVTMRGSLIEKAGDIYALGMLLHDVVEAQGRSAQEQATAVRQGKAPINKAKAKAVNALH